MKCKILNCENRMGCALDKGHIGREKGSLKDLVSNGRSLCPFSQNNTFSPLFAQSYKCTGFYNNLPTKS